MVLIRVLAVIIVASMTLMDSVECAGTCLGRITAARNFALLARQTRQKSSTGENGMPTEPRDRERAEFGKARDWVLEHFPDFEKSANNVPLVSQTMPKKLAYYWMQLFAEAARREERKRCIDKITEMKLAYATTDAPGWQLVVHEADQLIAALGKED